LRQMREHDKKDIEYESLTSDISFISDISDVSDLGDISDLDYISDSDSGDYYHIGDVESGIVKVKSVFVGGSEYFVDRENNVYDVLSFDTYGLLLQIGTYDCVEGRVEFVDPLTV